MPTTTSPEAASTVRRAPIAPITRPVSGSESSEPHAPTKRMTPIWSGASSSASRTAGSREAQLAKVAPLSRKTAKTLAAARRTRRVSTVVGIGPRGSQGRGGRGRAGRGPRIDSTTAEHPRLGSCARRGERGVRHSGTTLTDVARAAGVSLSTASLAFSGAGPISDATRDKVLAAAAELGYHGPNPVAASLRRGRSGVVGIVMGAAVRRAFRDPVSIQFLDGIVATLAAQGYGTLLLSTPEAQELPDALLTHGAMDTAVLTAGALTSRRTLAALRARGVPMVQLGGTGRQGPAVRARDKQGMKRLGEHLRERGHERVAGATLPWHVEPRSGPVDLASARRA